MQSALVRPGLTQMLSQVPAIIPDLVALLPDPEREKVAPSATTPRQRLSKRESPSGPMTTGLMVLWVGPIVVSAGGTTPFGREDGG